MRKFLLFLVLVVFNSGISNRLNSQTETKAELEEQAYAAFNDYDYATAYSLFDKLNSKYPKEFDYKFKLGLCCLHYPDRKARAIEIFTSIKSEVKGLDIDYYLGKAYHVNYRFSEAISLLENFLIQKELSSKKADQEMVDDARNILINCMNGLTLVNTKAKAKIINIGPPINSEELEGCPIISTDESILIFTYAGKKSTGGKLDDELKSSPYGKYREDIFISIKGADSVYHEPKKISSINTLGNDAAIALSPDGTTLFTFSSNNDAGDISVSNLNGNEWSKPEKLNKNINSDAWEGSCSISADGNYLYFASERPGGFGGKDIYVSEKVDGDWGPAVNLGDQINTPLNDDAPFIHPDGITLFFSSQGHMSIGGYDIMFSVKRDNAWLEPKSMGLPLNTTEDDRYYVINSKGDKGFFSSNRGGAGGKGDQDIYMVTPGILGERPVIALLKGVVYGDDKPMEAQIEVLKITQKENIGPYFSNKKTGKYLMALSPGFIYRIKVVAEGFESIEEDLDIEALDKYLESQKDFYLYRPGITPTAVVTPTAAPTKTVVETPTLAVVTPTAEPTKTVVKTPTLAVVTPTAEPTKTVVETPTLAVVTPTAEPTKTVEPDVVVTNTTAVTPTVEVSPTVAVTTETTASSPTVANVKEPVLPCDSQLLPDVNSIKGKSLNDITVYNQMLSLAGNYCAEGLVFKVQIGAYRKPENYKYSHLIQYGKPEVVGYPDGITRFTQMEFNTIKKAEVQRQKAISKGQKDAWIVAFVNGKRYTLEELIMLDFLGKAIN